jgi:hypothetical protein
MRPRCLVAATFAIVLFSGTCLADSVPMDNFVFAPGWTTLTWSFTLPASPPPTNSSLYDINLGPIPVWTAIGAPSSRFVPYVIVFYGVPGDPYRFDMFCNSDTTQNPFCDTVLLTSFTSPLFSGTPENPTFILGNHDGILLITAAPEPPQFALIFAWAGFFILSVPLLSGQFRNIATRSS